MDNSPGDDQGRGRAPETLESVKAALWYLEQVDPAQREDALRALATLNKIARGELEEGYQAELKRAQETLARLVEAVNRRLAELRRSPHAFRDGAAWVPSSITLQGLLTAYYDAEAGALSWGRTPDGLPMFSHSQPQGTVSVVLRPSGQAALDRDVRQALWEQVSQLSDLDGDVLLAFMAQAMQTADGDAGADVWISAQQILDYRGIRPKTKREGLVAYRAGHRREDIEPIGACVERLRNTWIELQGVEYLEDRPGRKPTPGRLTIEGQLVELGERAVQHSLGGESLVVAWRFRLGRAVRAHLTAPNRQVARVLQQALRYDPYHERWEKRLARYFTFHLRIGRKGGDPLPRRIGAVLDELRLSISRRNPSVSRERFEKAMDRLVADGVVGGWGYSARAKATLAKLPARGWLKDWLGCTVEVRVLRPSLPPVEARALPAPAEE